MCVSVSPAAETKTSSTFPDCGATVHVEDDALAAEERPVGKKASVSLSQITN